MIINTVLLGIIGAQELLILGLIILVFFGGKKIPELMRGLGKGVKEFKDGVEGLDVDIDKKDNAKKKEAETDEKEKK